eukprot:738655-Amphidinium_carterae.1
MTGAPFSPDDVEFAITTKRYADGDVDNHIMEGMSVAKLAQAKGEHDEYPLMPVTHCEYDHREKFPSMPEWSAMVTKQLSNKEILQDPLAQEAMTKEYKRHQNKTWDETKVREYDD